MLTKVNNIQTTMCKLPAQVTNDNIRKENQKILDLVYKYKFMFEKMTFHNNKYLNLIPDPDQTQAPLPVLI